MVKEVASQNVEPVDMEALSEVEDYQEQMEDESPDETNYQQEEAMEHTCEQDVHQDFYDQQAIQSAEERNPRNYKHLPSCFTKRIIPAGRYTYRSEGLSSLLQGH